jgi:hypothetical protein
LLFNPALASMHDWFGDDAIAAEGGASGAIVWRSLRARSGAQAPHSLVDEKGCP